MGTTRNVARLVLGLCIAAACTGGGAPSPTAVPTAAPPSARRTALATVGPTASPSPPAVTICTGTDLYWSELPQAVRAYAIAWNERDDTTRLSLLEEALEEDGSYVNPLLDRPLVGPEAVAANIDNFQEGRVGQDFEVRAWSQDDYHHDRMRLRWRLCDAGGQTLLEGEDIMELASDGRIRKVTGFFDDAANPASTAVVCAGDDLLWELLPPPAQAYALAWLEGEQAERVGLLEEGMAADASYADPETSDRVSGLPAIAEHIGVFQEGHRGHFFRVRAWVPTDEHHDHVRVRWILCRQADARIVLEGEDILVLDEAGLIRQATRFIDA